MNRRAFFQGLGVLGMLGLHTSYALAKPLPLVTVYKNPMCGCCAQWVEHLQAEGFEAKVIEVDDTSVHRKRLGIPDAMASCHTAEVAGYGLEGHVPASEIKAMLSQRPRIKALAVPGMPANSPGMGPAVGPAFKVMQVLADGSVSVYSSWPRQ